MFEVSGGINLLNIKSYAKLGVDFISTSKITNSAKSVDIGLDIL
jgi:nicotinate-nucleotide pyrophosphorylase (carboxylating)